MATNTLESWECKLIVSIFIISGMVSSKDEFDYPDSYHYNWIGKEIIYKAEKKYLEYLGDIKKFNADNLIIKSIKDLMEYLELRLRGDLK